MSDDLVMQHPPMKPPAGLSADRRRTIRRQRHLGAGVHPATGYPLLAQPPRVNLTCGDCARCFRMPGVAGTYWKCELTATRGPGSDIRKSWPACNAFATTRDTAGGMTIKDLLS